MTTKDKELAAVPKDEYTFQMLLTDIQESALGADKDAPTGSNVGRRERQYMLTVMQMLILKANEHKGTDCHDDARLRNDIDVTVNNDAHLAGYMFFVSQNPQFGYSWNYLIKRGNSYREFLVEGIRFLDNVLVDINMLAGRLRTHMEVHAVIGDIIDVSLIGERPYVQARVLWENFHRVATVKREYNFTVKYGECVMAVGQRKESADAEVLVDAVLADLDKKVGSTK